VGTDILLSLGLLLAIVVIITSAFIAVATLMRIIRGRGKTDGEPSSPEPPQDPS
jgi:hypothetical protein